MLTGDVPIVSPGKAPVNGATRGFGLNAACHPERRRVAPEPKDLLRSGHHVWQARDPSAARLRRFARDDSVA
jgi:hypothetical protein